MSSPEDRATDSADSEKTTWVGVAFVAPAEGSFLEKRGLQGGYGFVAFKGETIGGGVTALEVELAEGGTRLVGFEWLSRIEDNERSLTSSDHELISMLDDYCVQFKDIHWYTETSE